MVLEARSRSGTCFERVARGAGRYAAPAWVYQRYAAEYRARVIDPVEAWSRYGDPSASASGSGIVAATRDPRDPDVIAGRLAPAERAHTAFATGRQERVWADLVRDPERVAWLDWQTGRWTEFYGYFPHYYALDPLFRRYVDQLGASSSHSALAALRELAERLPVP
jgi:hypothetical protein